MATKSSERKVLLEEQMDDESTAKDLIVQLRAMSPGDGLYHAKITVLAAYIHHQAEEEDGDKFLNARHAGLGTYERIEARGEDWELN